jgi:hypothetical protein
MHTVDDLTTPLHNRSCLFRSVECGATHAQLPGFHEHKLLRQRTAEFILTHPKHSAVKVHGGMFEVNKVEEGAVNLNLKEYGDWLKDANSYGGDLEVRILAELLEVDITLFSLRSHGGVQTLHGMAPADIFRGRESSSKPTMRSETLAPLPHIRIVRTGAGQNWKLHHFDAVLPIDGNPTRASGRTKAGSGQG